jgi:hypothetical protein
MIRPEMMDAMTPDQVKQYQAISVVVSQTIPPSAIKNRKGKGGKTFSYLPHAWVTRTLNDALSFRWSFEILPGSVVISKAGVYLLGKLTIHLPDGTVIVKQGHGWKATVPNMELGHMILSAESNCINRCAMRFGIGLDLYATEDEPTPNEIKTTLCNFGKRHLGWTAKQTLAWLKEQGYSGDQLATQGDEMYEALATRAGKRGPTETFDDIEDGDGPDDVEDPLVTTAKVLWLEAAEEFGWISDAHDARDIVLVQGIVGDLWNNLEEATVATTIREIRTDGLIKIREHKPTGV